MKLTTHANKPKPATMELQASPMTVWLDNHLELKIERGDRLKKIAGVIREHWGLGKREAYQLAAYWFAIGERVHTGSSDQGWTRSELSADPDRRYLR